MKKPLRIPKKGDYCFVLRLPVRVAKDLEARAIQENRSLNGQIVEELTKK